MPTLPWATPPGSSRPPETDQPVEIMTSRFVLRSRRQTARMLRHALAVRRAALDSPGVRGVSLIARPLRREYWTLSAWSDRASLDTFVAHPVHRAAMSALGPAMAEAAFRFWSSSASALPPSWDDARSALREPDGDPS